MKRQQFEDQESQPILGNHSISLDWESFKKRYYAQENTIMVALTTLTVCHGETSKKLALLDGDSDTMINDFDEQENKKTFNKIDLNKVKEHFITLNELMDQMKQLLNDIQIDSNEPQLKMKQNMLRRFKEIHDEHEKELKRIKEPFEINLKKYDLFKDTFQREKDVFQKYDKDDFKHNRSLKRQLDQTDSVIEIARSLQNSFSNQGQRLNGIQSKVSELIGNFHQVNNLIRQIKTLTIRNQLMILILVVTLTLFIAYQLFSG